MLALTLLAATGNCAGYTASSDDSSEGWGQLPGADANGPPPQHDADASLPAGDGGMFGDAGVPSCDVSEPLPAAALFVSAPLSLDAGAADGGPQRPFTSIAAAVAALESGAGAVIVLAAGTYKESLSLTKAVDYNMQGAWIHDSAGWRRDCAPDYASRTLIASTDEVGLRVDHANSLTLRNLSVQSSQRADLAQTTRYGVHAVETNVRLDGVRVSAMDGRAGAAGAGGAGAGSPPCQLAPACEAAPTAGSTTPRAPGAAASGTFSELGYAPGNGKDGTKAGGLGSAGTPGGSGASDAFCANGSTCKAPFTCSLDSGTVKAGNGRCGCGGSGGQPARGGVGGGASVALYVVGKGIEVIDSHIVAGSGGNGGAGGDGGLGGMGAPGVAGSSAKCWSVQCCRCADACFGGDEWQGCCPNPKPTSKTLAGGTVGGRGASGGDGQGGGAGAGGPSYSVVRVGGAVRIDTRSQYSFGAGGTAPPGAAVGTSGLELVVP